MSNIWSTEAWAIILAAVALCLLAFVTGNWLVASLITLCGYIAWLYQRLLKLENWIRKGTKISQVYEDPGFVGVILRLLYEQKKIHSQRKRRTKQILRRLNQNISALPDAAVLLNKDFQIQWCNDPARYLLNLRSPQDLGYRITSLIRDRRFVDYLEDPKELESVEIESPFDRRIILQIQAVSFGGNKTLLIARNVSSARQLQESLKNFVANASHELRSPLTVISGHLEMLGAERKLSSNGKRSLKTARRQAERMRELIQDLLLLSQVESYQLGTGQGDRVSIDELMVNVMAALDKYSDRERIRIDYPPRLVLLGLKVELEGICINLLENALKYTTRGTPIDARWEINEQNEYLFSVSDQGPGIEPEEIVQLTERYYRGRRSRAEIAGTGLGLAIVQQAANKHGATFKIDSTVGGGSRFIVTFPNYRSLHQAPQETARVLKIADY